MPQLLGATVAVARDGREALDMIAGASPDLVLCDLRMPRMDGFEFMGELNQAPSGPPPVVAMSGLVSGADRDRTRKAGFESHISKPFDRASIFAAFDAVVSRRQKEFPVPGMCQDLQLWSQSVSTRTQKKGGDGDNLQFIPCLQPALTWIGMRYFLQLAPDLN